jgi:two-component system LytT family sensor kinase
MSTSKQSISWVEIMLITLLWILIFIVTPLNWKIDFPSAFYLKQLVFALLLTAIYYINGRFLVDYLISPKGLLKFLGWALIIIAVTLALLQLFEWAISLPEKMHHAIRPGRTYHPDRGFRLDLFGLFFIILNIGFSSVVSLVRKNQKDAQEKQELEKQKISSELSFLKAQINPHFFFNTLNSIYALTDLDVENAKGAIHTLSAMMRYVLYESQKDNTTVKKEVAFIENYIQLMRLRLTEKVKVTFEKPTHDQEFLIAPMLFLPFVENAFKHGVSNHQESAVNISMTTAGSLVTFEVSNTIIPSQSQSLDEKGIGLNNTKRRLELIYPQQHELHTEVNEDRYLVRLKLDLH